MSSEMLCCRIWYSSSKFIGMALRFSLFYGQKMEITGAKEEINSGTLVVKLDANSCVETKQREKEAFESYSLNTEQAIDELAFRLFGFERMRPFQHKIRSRF